MMLMMMIIMMDGVMRMVMIIMGPANDGGDTDLERDEPDIGDNVGSQNTGHNIPANEINGGDDLGKGHVLRGSAINVTRGTRPVSPNYQINDDVMVATWFYF